jgi:hypothetical protein
MERAEREREREKEREVGREGGRFQILVNFFFFKCRGGFVKHPSPT